MQTDKQSTHTHKMHHIDQAEVLITMSFSSQAGSTKNLCLIAEEIWMD